MSKSVILRYWYASTFVNMISIYWFFPFTCKYHRIFTDDFVLWIGFAGGTFKLVIFFKLKIFFQPQIYYTTSSTVNFSNLNIFFLFFILSLTKSFLAFLSCSHCLFFWFFNILSIFLNIKNCTYVFKYQYQYIDTYRLFVITTGKWGLYFRYK